jgi:uncharacterized protein (DUF1330 family)
MPPGTVPAVPLTLCVLLTPVAGAADRLVEYEDQVLARLPAHGARLLSRVRAEDPEAEPFEVHLIEFPSEAGLEDYLADPARVAMRGLRDAAIASTEILRVEVV